MFDFGLGAGSSFFLINGGNVLGNFIVPGKDMKEGKLFCLVLGCHVTQCKTVYVYVAGPMNLIPFYMDSLGRVLRAVLCLHFSIA